MKLKELLSLTLSESLYIFLSLNLPCPPSSLLPLWISQSLCLFINQTQQRLMMGWSMSFVYSSSWCDTEFSLISMCLLLMQRVIYEHLIQLYKGWIFYVLEGQKKKKFLELVLFYGHWEKGFFYTQKLIILENNINYIFRFYLII
jgi:hypothetical protein